MAKKTPPPAEPDGPSSETVRIATDLLEILRELCFHSRDNRGKRVRLSQYVDNVLRPVLIREHQALRKRLAGETKEKD